MQRKTTELLESLFKRAEGIQQAWQALTECKDETFETKKAFWQNYEAAVKDFRRLYQDHAKELLNKENIDSSKLIEALVSCGELNPLTLIAIHKTMDSSCFYEPVFRPFKGISN